MTTILQSLPFGPDVAEFVAGSRVIATKPFQIVCWASVTLSLSDRPSSKRFPILIDTGHSGSFCLHDGQLRDWAGVEPSQLPLLRQRKINGIACDVRDAVLWLYPNVRGQRKIDSAREIVRVELSDGIEVLPARINFPRIPLLGLKTIAHNHLRLIVNGDAGHVSLGHR